MGSPDMRSAMRYRALFPDTLRVLWWCGLVAIALGLGMQDARASDGASPTHDAAALQASDPLTLVVSLDAQRIDVYRGEELLDSSRISTGRPGYATPAGVYSILDKRRYHRSNIYSRAPMPFMLRITWSGIALHAGNVPDYPASHGCIRLPTDFASNLFGITERGAHVIVAAGEASLQRVRHAALFQPASLVEHVSSVATLEDGGGYDTMVVPVSLSSDFEQDVPAAVAVPEVRSSSPLRILITRRTGREQIIDAQTLLIELGYEAGEVDGYMGPATGKAILAFQNDHELQPTGAFSDILLANLFRFAGRGAVPSGHIYVRQDYVDILDAPMHLENPEVLLGTHVYEALDFVHDGEDVRWVGATLEPAAGTDMAGALDRVQVPADIRERIADMLTPGSSLIISDHGLGRETGRGTDFIVQPR